MSSLRDQVRDWHRGVQAVARGDWDCALRFFSGVRQPPAKICFNVGCVHLMAGDPEAALRVLYNMASAQCQVGLWTQAANTLEEAISKWPEGAQDSLDIALNQVQTQVPLKLWQVPKGEVFWPPRQHLKHLEPMDFLGKAKVVAPSIPDNQHSDVWLQQRPQVEQVGSPPPPSTGLLASERPGPGSSEDSSGARGAVAKGPESSVAVTVQCHFTVALKAPRGAGLSSLRALLAQALLHQAQMGQLRTLRSYQASEEERLWIPVPTEESLQSMWKDVALGPRGLQLQCRGAGGRPVLYQVVAQHDYSAHRPEDLNFHRGDMVDVLCEVDEAWLEGHCNGCIGIFPKCFVVPLGACEEALPAQGPQPEEQH